MSRWGGLVGAAGVAALLLAPRPVWAWGGDAHRVVALVAERVLAKEDPAALAKLRQILAGDTSNDWTKTDIASEATWADALREHSPEARIATTEWHYARLDFVQPDLTKDCFGRPPLPAGYPASHGPRTNCIVDKIQQFSMELRDPKTSPEERLAALKFLLNLVGDLHEPLNVIDRKDMNGACVAVQSRERQPVSLKEYWDDLLVVDAVGRNPDKAAAGLFAALTGAEIKRIEAGPPEAWAQQSYALAKNVAYDLPHARGDEKYVFPAGKAQPDKCGAAPLYHLDAAYRAHALAAVKEQLTRAGVRLAFLLQQDLR